MNCGTCRYFIGDDGGSCRRHPPTVVVVPPSEGRKGYDPGGPKAVFPEVSPSDSCGDFEPTSGVLTYGHDGSVYVRTDDVA